MVMLFHYTASTSIQLLDENPLRIVGAYGHLGVEMFFILSGFVIPYSMYASSYKIDAIGKFLLKRSIRIEIPYLVLIALEVLLIYASSFTPWKNGVSERLNAYNIVLHVGYLNGILGRPWLIPVFWTLAIEFQFYLLIAILFPLLLQTEVFNRIAVVAIVALFSFFFPHPYLFFNYGLLFLAGILAFQFMIGVIKRQEFFVFVACVMVLLYFQREPLSLVVVASTLTVILFFKLDFKWSAFLGMISYSIYLIHVPFGGRLLMLTQMYSQSEWTKTVLIVIYLGSTVFVAWLFYLFVEKPSLLLSRKVKYKDKA